MDLAVKISGTKVYLDVNVFIYLLEGHMEFSKPVLKIFNLIDEGKITSITSELSLAEALVKPMSSNDMRLQQLYKTTIKPSSVLNVVPITREILIKAAEVRASLRSIKLPDAIHISSAQSNNCNFYITNDGDGPLRKIKDIETILISELI